METNKTIDILTPLMCAYPAAKITDETIQVYAVALSELSETELSAGVLRCMRTCKFFPSIAEIMEAANNMVESISGTKTKAADEAWKEMCAARSKYWPSKEPVFSTPEIEEAVKAMGWRNLCTEEQENIGTTRAQFLRLYDSVCNRKKEKRINANVARIMGTKGLIKQIDGGKSIGSAS